MFRWSASLLLSALTYLNIISLLTSHDAGTLGTKASHLPFPPSDATKTSYIPSGVQVMQQICQGHLLERPDGCPDPVHKIMTGCWRMNPNERWNFSAIIALLTAASEDSMAPGDDAADGDDLKSVEVEDDYEDEEDEDDNLTVTWDKCSTCDGDCVPLECEEVTSV